MAALSPPPTDRFEQSLFIAAPPATVFNYFFAPDALRSWWQVVRSVTTPVPLGVYAIEWATTPYRDDVLGPLGGVFHGTIVDFRPGEQFLAAEPDLGSMTEEIEKCFPALGKTNADQIEKEFFLFRSKRVFPRVKKQFQHAGIHLGGRRKAGLGNVEAGFDFSAVADREREAAVMLGAGKSGQPLGHFFMHGQHSF